MREPGYLLKRFVCVRSCKYGAAAAFGAERRLRQFSELPQPFRFFGAVYVVSPLPFLTDCPPKYPCVLCGGESLSPAFFAKSAAAVPMAAAAFVVML